MRVIGRRVYACSTVIEKIFVHFERKWVWILIIPVWATLLDGLFGAPGCLRGFPIKIMDRFFRRPSWISFFNWGIWLARSRSEAVRAGLSPVASIESSNSWTSFFIPGPIALASILIQVKTAGSTMNDFCFLKEQEILISIMQISFMRVKLTHMASTESNNSWTSFFILGPIALVSKWAFSPVTSIKPAKPNSLFNSGPIYLASMLMQVIAGGLPGQQWMTSVFWKEWKILLKTCKWAL